MAEEPPEAANAGLEVACYEGYRAEERPVRFRLGPHWHSVEKILDRWHGPDDRYFKLLAEDGDIYILRRGEAGWSLVSYRRRGAR